MSNDPFAYKTFNVHWRLVNMRGKTAIQALTQQDARKVFEACASSEANDQERYPFEARVTRVVGPLGEYKATTKQILARKYNFLQGSIRSAMMQFNSIAIELEKSKEQYGNKVARQYALVDSQFAKTQRDLRELGKMLGLKLK